MVYSEFTPPEVRAQLEARDGDAPRCILCLAGVPANDTCDIAVAYHHLRKPRGLAENNQVHLLAPAGIYHHQMFDEYKIWALALVKLGRQKKAIIPI